MAWLTAWVVLMSGLLIGLVFVRKNTLTTLSTPQARADWHAWRDMAAKQSAEGPVQRRIPKSMEPPALVLMRDYFPVVVVSSCVLSSLLFVVVGWITRGTFAQR